METHNVISVSGGKDSTATLLLALERETPNVKAVFADTGHEHSLTYEYISYLSDNVYPIQTVRADFTSNFEKRRKFLMSDACKWPDVDKQRALDLLKPTGIPFLDLCIVKGRFPSAMAQFCTQELKRKPIYEQVFEPLISETPMPRIVSWQGIRHEESRKRRNATEWEAELGDLAEGPGLFIYRPLLDWSAQDVFAFLKKHGVKPNPLYLQGMARVGCMPCIYTRKGELEEIAKRWPEEIERVAEWERLVSRVARKDGSATFFYVRDNSKPIHYQTHGILSLVKSTHSNGLFDDDESTVCSSWYGLCE